MAEESVGFISMVSEDLRRIRESITRVEVSLEATRSSIVDLRTGKIQSLEIDIEKLRAKVAANEDLINKIIEGQKWIVRLIVGALISGAVAVIYQLAIK